MSVNIYVSEKIRNAPGFVSTPYPDGSGNRMKFNGISVFGDKGSLYIMHGNDDPLPSVIQEFVEKVSFYESVYTDRTIRETGIYRHADAEAEVDINHSNKNTCYLVKIKAKKLDTARELLRLIKTGKIRPEESFEGRQQGKSRIELEAQNALLSGKIMAIQKIADDLSCSGLPLAFTKRIVTKIEIALATMSFAN